MRWYYYGIDVHDCETIELVLLVKRAGVTHLMERIVPRLRPAMERIVPWLEKGATLIGGSIKQRVLEPKMATEYLIYVFCLLWARPYQKLGPNKNTE